MTHMIKVVHIDVGDVIIIKGEDERRGNWKIGVMDQDGKRVPRMINLNVVCSRTSLKC